MEKYKVVTAHTSEYPEPISLVQGEQVRLGERAPEENWKDWIWAENDRNEGGWVPIQLIEMLEGQDIVREDYSAKELNTREGEELIKIKAMNAWTWVRRLHDNAEGWVPDETIAVV